METSIVERPDLANELEQMATEDLAVRQRLIDAGELFGGYNTEMRAVHRRNGDRFTAILDEVRSWPGHRLVGIDGSRAALLIVQHDIANPTLMRRCHDLYLVAVELSDADPDGLAYLEDRIRSFEGRSQRYGTQLGWNEQGEFGPWPAVEEPERVEERRATLGLPSLAETISARVTERKSRRPVEEMLDEHRGFEDFARSAGWRKAAD